MALNEREKRSVHVDLVVSAARYQQYKNRCSIWGRKIFIWKCMKMSFQSLGTSVSDFPIVSLYIITFKTSKTQAKSFQIICHKNTSLLVKKFWSFEKNVWCLSRDSWHFLCAVSVNQARFVVDPDSTVDLSHHLICSNLPDNSERERSSFPAN